MIAALLMSVQLFATGIAPDIQDARNALANRCSELLYKEFDANSLLALLSADACKLKSPTGETAATFIKRNAEMLDSKTLKAQGLNITARKPVPMSAKNVVARLQQIRTLTENEGFKHNIVPANDDKVDIDIIRKRWPSFLKSLDNGGTGYFLPCTVTLPNAKTGVAGYFIVVNEIHGVPKITLFDDH